MPESFIFELDDIDYIEEALCDVPEVIVNKSVHIPGIVYACPSQVVHAFTKKEHIGRYAFQAAVHDKA